MRALAIIAAVLNTCAIAQDFRPYPQRHVTQAQWQAYFDEVKSKHAASAQIPPGQHIVIFPAAARTYVFTQPGHIAHPAWTTRQIEQRPGEVIIERIGYFAGDGRSFGDWYLTFLALDERFKRHVKDKHGGGT